MKCIVTNLHIIYFLWLTTNVYVNTLYMCVDFGMFVWTCEQGETQLKQDEYWEWSLQTSNYGRGIRDRHFTLTNANKKNYIYDK
jgi:hypothetical protein